MKSFSSDSDILRYEPVLFGDMRLGVNTLISGTGGVVSGTQFTAAGASFVSAGVEAGCIIHLSNAAGVIASFYEVVSVDSATQLTVSILRDDRDGPAKAPPQAGEVSYRVCSYAPQANDAFIRLCEYFRITAQEAATIPNIASLRQASVFLTMATVFAAIASREGFAQTYLDKSDYYTDRFLQALDECVFIVCIGGRKIRRSGGELYLGRE